MGRYEQPALLYGVFGLILIVLSLTTGIAFPAVIVSTILLYRLVPLPQDISYLSFRLVLAIVLQLTIFNVFGLFSHIINVDISNSIYGALSLGVVGAGYALRYRSRDLQHAGKITHFDLSILMPVILSALIIAIYIFGNSLSFSENLIRFMGSSSDQSAHLSMFNDILRNDGNYVYSTDKMSINTPGINSYPMGWHQTAATTALVFSHIDAAVAPFKDVVSVYFLYSALTFLLHITLVSIFVYLIYDRFIKPSDVEAKESFDWRDLLIKTIISMTIIFLFSYLVFSGLGYINYIYALSVVMLGGIVVMGLRNDADISASVIVLLTLLLFAAMEAWYIMGLPLGLVLLYVVICYFKAQPSIKLRGYQIWLILLGFGLVGVAILATLKNIIADNSGSQIMIGNAAAPWLPSNILLVFVVVSAVIIVNTNKVGLLHVFINAFFTTILLFTLLNLVNLQEYSYYQQKMLFALYALGIPLVGVIAIRYLHRNGVKPIITVVALLFSIYMLQPGYITSMTKSVMRPSSDIEVAIIDKYFDSKFNDQSKRVEFIKDYRKGSYGTEAYGRLMLSKVYSRGDCYNQLIMPLLSLKNSLVLKDKGYGMDINQITQVCYGDAQFYTLREAEGYTIEYVDE